jgi:hypothetical protein
MHPIRLKDSRTSTFLAVVALSLSTMACASVDPGAVRSEIGSAESALAQAVDQNARQHAPLELKLAEEKLSLANQAFENDDYQEALYLAEKAQADARLAEVKAQNAETTEMVESLKKSITDLRQEIEANEPIQPK